MGLAYTIDSPIRVALYAISSIISVIDVELIKKMNLFYSKKFNKKHQGISNKTLDYHTERVTFYLNLVHEIVNKNSLRSKRIIRKQNRFRQLYCYAFQQNGNQNGMLHLIKDSISFK